MESRLLLSAGFLTSDQDIGSPSPAGSIAFNNGTYTITGAGTGTHGNSDQFNYAYSSFAGNVNLIADLNSINTGSASGQAGLMIRNDTTASSAFVSVALNSSNQIIFTTRASNGASATQTIVGSVRFTPYIELSFSGSTITAYYSYSGSSWTSVGSASNVSLSSAYLVGLEASSNGNTVATTANFSVLSILPAGFSDNDIGGPPLPGGAAYTPASNSFTVNGSGSGISATADQLNFANYAMTGDNTVTALVSSQASTASAGVMIRSDTTSGSLFAALDDTQNQLTFEWRAGSALQASSSVSISGPLWLRVVDASNNFSAYYSSDDVTWTQVGATESVSMPSAITLAGVYTSSNSSTALTSTTFSNVSVIRGGWTDTDIGAPTLTGSAVYDAPSDTFTLNGSGSDISGTSDQFNFPAQPYGDGSVLAYVDSLTNTNASARAGVMIRNDTSAGSVFAALLVSPGSGLTFEWRTASGVTTSQEVNASITAPVGLKLTRAGSTISAYYSTDGINWTSIGPSQSVTMNTAALAGVAVTSHNTAAICTAAFSSVYVGNSPPPGAGVYSASDQLFLNDLEYRETMYYYDETNSSTGLVPDNALANGGSPSPNSSIAAIGFGLSALTIADARGWLSHSQAYQRALTTINFLYNSGANVNGFYYHFLNETTGARYGTSEVSSVDTAELMAGVLNAAQYWSGTALQTTGVAMFDRVNWPWMQQGNGIFYGAWTPESGFSGGYGDFSEAVLLYLLGLGSPTYPTTTSSWLAWSRSPKETYSGYSFVEADDAALFTEQYPQAWFNLQGLTDATGLNYYVNSQSATLAQRQFQINLSSTYSDYGPNMWGLTPAEGINGYTVWGGPPAYGPIDGTVVPTGPGGSLEFEPRLSLNALEYMKQTYPSTYLKYGLVDAFNPLKSYTSNLALGIDVGMTVIAAENARSNLVWNSFNASSIAQQAISRAFPSKSGPSVWASTSGNWNTTLNWANGVIPNAAGAEADLFGAISSPATVYTNVGDTVGTLHFNNANEYVIAGAGALTIQSSSGNALIEVDQGTDEINVPLTLASNTTVNVASGATLIIGNPLTINAGVTLTPTGGGTIVYNSTINLGSGAGIAFAQSAYVSQLTMAAGATADIAGSGTVLELSSLPTGGTIDLQNNTLLIDYSSSTDPAGSVRSSLASGYNGGAWNGAGIVSSAAAATGGKYSIGYADGADGVVAGLASGQIEIKYTLSGDANLDGKVNGADLAIVSANMNKATSAWDQGDFNYDNKVNGADYAMIASNFNQGSNAPAAVMPAVMPVVVPAQTLTAATTAAPSASGASGSSSAADQSSNVTAGVLGSAKKNKRNAHSHHA